MTGNTCVMLISSDLYTFYLNVTVKWSALLLLIPEVHGSTLGRSLTDLIELSFGFFIWSPQENTWTEP
jgi:hypothetical protein